MLLSHFADRKLLITFVVIYQIRFIDSLKLTKAKEVYFLLYNFHIFLFSLFLYVSNECFWCIKTYGQVAISNLELTAFVCDILHNLASELQNTSSLGAFLESGD